MPDFDPGNPELIRLISEEISRVGPIPFARFMDLALYHPELGYYTAPAAPIGRDGDYYTSTHVHPIFGTLITRQIEDFWNVLGRPDPFTAVEMGAGKGWLCADILRAVSPEFSAALRYVISERSPSLRLHQAETLRAAGISGDRIIWTDLDSLEIIEGCFFSNELVDAFPVHRVVRRGDALREIHVDRDGDRLIERELALSTPDLDSYFAESGVDLADGQAADVNLAARPWLRSVARALRRGFLLTVDYGHEAHRLFSPARFRGTLLCYHQHKANEEPLARAGRQDITAHVDFSALVRWGAEAGLSAMPLSNQAFFLLSLGISDTMRSDALESLSPDEALRRNAALKRLIDPDGLGAFRVLIQHKGLDAPPALLGLTHLP